MSETSNALQRSVFGPSIFNAGDFTVPRDMVGAAEDHLYLIDSYQLADEPAPPTPVGLRGAYSCKESSMELEDDVLKTRKHEANDKISNLDLHLRRIGADGKFAASVCQYCGKEFKRSCDLGE